MNAEELKKKIQEIYKEVQKGYDCDFNIDDEHNKFYKMHEEMDTLIDTYDRTVIIKKEKNKIIAEGECNLGFNEGSMIRVGGISSIDGNDCIGGFDLDKLLSEMGYNRPKKIRVTIEVLDGTENKEK